MSLSPTEILDFLKAQIGKEIFETPSPYGKWLGGKILAAEEGTLSIEFLVRQDMTNPIGILHGGVIAGIMDDTIGMTVAALEYDTYSVSTNLAIDYLSSGKIGDHITATATIIRKGQNMVNTECKVTNREGKLLAKGTANLFRTNIPKK